MESVAYPLIWMSVSGGEKNLPSSLAVHLYHRYWCQFYHFLLLPQQDSWHSSSSSHYVKTFCPPHSSSPLAAVSLSVFVSRMPYWCLAMISTPQLYLCKTTMRMCCSFIWDLPSQGTELMRNTVLVKHLLAYWPVFLSLPMKLFLTVNAKINQ